ncbi:MAG TPA: NAD-dependent DNA ligase LigA [Polyangiaceae bacterium LLY-WYZ-14_1]|nr:NAD-dependent DNA ligase LigA [Polyangiaceae bacterium LLY-WYZ-14_1]
MAPADRTTVPKDARARHGELVQQIRDHDHRYYVLDAPTVSDAAYDALFEELRKLEETHPALVTPESPSQRVGAPPREGFVQVPHRHRMYSLDNSYDEESLREFDRRVREGLPSSADVRYVAEPKLDGASLEMVFRDGRLALAITRGDGRVGEDVTLNARTIRSLPLEIPDTRELTARGEVVIRREDLQTVNRQRQELGEEPFANPRNAAAGSLRLLDSSLTAKRPLRIVLYDVVEPYWETHGEMLAGLRELGLPTHGLEERCPDLDAVFRYIERFERRRGELPYETDGVVVKVDRLSHRPILGFTARFPRWAIAFKFPAERGQTIVRQIEVDVGRTGALTPVATLDPIKLSGTTVSRASLHNVDYVAAKDVRVGDTVTVEKAGEIIPQVLEVNVAARPPDAVSWEPPRRCPVCDTAVERAEGAVALRCPNPVCKGKLRAGLFYFTRRSGMDIDGFGKVLIEQVLDRGLVEDLADIFALPERRDELISLERVGEKTADNLITNIEEARTGRTFERLITALGIPLVGGVAARLVAERYRSLEGLLAEDPETVRPTLAEIHGIGPKIADAVADYLAEPGNRALLEKMVRLGVRAEQPEAAPAVTEGPLVGARVAVTGVLSKPREAVQDEIRAAGGEVHDRVKKGTTYLVAGERTGKTKLDAAKKHGTRVIDEDGLAALLAGEPLPDEPAKDEG